ncbi:MAG TPA: hypothetical protein GYA10_08265 [Alphaproteobacteria bacterium]|nr:hypothetical protein [Alphaproteobacteria bacterium]
MKLLGPLARSVAIVGLSAAGCLAATGPVFAGKAEVAMLQSYVGSWKGRGQLIGAESESVVCRMTISPGNDDKVNYSGRCALAGQTVAVNGTLAYIDAKRRFEAAMTTNAGFTGLAIGQKSGGGVVFNLREKEQDDQGNDLQITAGITLTEARITVDFNVVFLETGDTISASVPFTK